MICSVGTRPCLHADSTAPAGDKISPVAIIQRPCVGLYTRMSISILDTPRLSAPGDDARSAVVSGWGSTNSCGLMTLLDVYFPDFKYIVYSIYTDIYICNITRNPSLKILWDLSRRDHRGNGCVLTDRIFNRSIKPTLPISQPKETLPTRLLSFSLHSYSMHFFLSIRIYKSILFALAEPSKSNGKRECRENFDTPPPTTEESLKVFYSRWIKFVRIKQTVIFDF